MPGLKKNLTFYFGLLFVAVFAFGAIIWQNSRAQTSDKYEEEFHQTIRDALAEIKLPTANNAAEINAVAENLADFIEYRSGVRLSQTNKTLLRELEAKSWNQSKKLNRGDLARILSDAAIERVSKATDAEIEYAAKTLCGFDAPDYPEYLKQKKPSVMMRADGRGYMDKEEFIEQSKVLRDTVKSNKIAQSFVVSAIDREIEQRINILATASPKDFGSGSDLTPAQAVLITYSLVTDDLPAKNRKDLFQLMENIQMARMRFSGKSFPSPNGYHAYGDNGYIFSTPASLLLDDATFGKILNGIREKGGIR